MLYITGDIHGNPMRFNTKNMAARGYALLTSKEMQLMKAKHLLTALLASSVFLFPVTADALTLNPHEQEVAALWSDKHQNCFTLDDQGKRIVFVNHYGKFYLIDSKGNHPVSFRANGRADFFSVKKITTDNPSKNFWIVYGVDGVRGLDGGLWIFGQQPDGTFVTYVTPETFDNLGYERHAGNHKVHWHVKDNKIIVIANREYMPEGAYYGYQRRSYVDFQAELFWDESANWFGIQRTI